MQCHRKSAFTLDIRGEQELNYLVQYLEEEKSFNFQLSYLLQTEIFSACSLKLCTFSVAALFMGS
jgi:hypothetical protein